MIDAVTLREVLPGLLKVAERAKRHPDVRMLALAHHIDEPALERGYRTLRRFCGVGSAWRVGGTTMRRRSPTTFGQSDRARAARARRGRRTRAAQTDLSCSVLILARVLHFQPREHADRAGARGQGARRRARDRSRRKISRRRSATRRRAFGASNPPGTAQHPPALHCRHRRRSAARWDRRPRRADIAACNVPSSPDRRSQRGRRHRHRSRRRRHRG